MTLILNIETAEKLCSVALSKDGMVLVNKESTESRVHASMLTYYIEQILKVQRIKIEEIDAIAVSKGPGSYTGLRIGVSVAKGLCYGADKQMISLNTLQIACWGLMHHEKLKLPEIDVDAWFCPMVDARRMEVYRAFFDSGCEFKSEVVADIIHSDSYNDILNTRQVVFFGSGSEKCKEVLQHRNAIFVDSLFPKASYMAELSFEAFKRGFFENTAYFEPFYLKDFVATTPNKGFF